MLSFDNALDLHDKFVSVLPVTDVKVVVIA